MSKINSLSSFLKFTTLLILFSGLGSASGYAAAPTGKTYAADPIIAVVDGKPLKITDIENKQINELRHQLFDLLNTNLKKAVLQQLGKTQKEFGRIPEFRIKDREAKAFFEANNLGARGTYDQLYPMIKQYLQQRNEAEHIQRLYARAVQQGLVTSYLASPNDFLTKVKVETAFLRGNKNASVMVLEFSDYQCPYCARVQPTLTELRNNYGKQVAFGYRHAPLPFHREADEAAIAAECARDQGKFIPYHNILFKNPQKLFPDDLKEYAKTVGIRDKAAFNKCLQNETYRPRLNNDQKAAASAGIRGTPGFVIGTYDPKKGVITGEIISGAQPKEVFVEMIEKYLKKSS